MKTRRFSLTHKFVLLAVAILLLGGAVIFSRHTHATLLPSANDILNENKGLLLFSSGGGNSFAVGALESSATSSLVSDFGNGSTMRGDRWLHLSPDRKLISITINPLGTDSPPFTYISDVNGTQLTKAYSGDFVSWAPDSSKVLLYVSPTEAPWDRYIYALDTKDNYSNTGLPNGTISADISPIDGSIVYSLASGGTDASTIHIRDQQGNDKVLVGGDSSILTWLRLSPKGDKIAFMKSNLAIDSGNQSVWVMNTDGTAPTKTSEVAWGYPPVWSPDGTKIAFSNGADIWEYDTNQKVLRNVTGSGKGAAHPSYSADGKAIVFSSGASGEQQVWAAQDGNNIQLTSGSQVKDYPNLP